MRFLFWNTLNNDVYPHLAKVAATMDVELIGLAESQFPPSYIIDELNKGRSGISRFRSLYADDAQGLHLVGTLPNMFVKLLVEEKRFVIFEVKPPGQTPVIACLLHLPSKLHASAGKQRDMAENVVERIEEAERASGHARTVIFGDFNMNPFEDGMMSFRAFNSTIHVDVIERLSGQRTLNSKKRSMFYNPMAKASFRDGAARGTYYYHDNDDVVHYWNLFDQALVRPELSPLLVKDDVRIIDKIGGVSLLTAKGIPDSKISDHLPIMFGFNLN
ncbi:MAG: hypothetical protein WCF85_07615 [Rhodospirillaceae bacterium]